jgi:hypothetical protein
VTSSAGTVLRASWTDGCQLMRDVLRRPALPTCLYPPPIGWRDRTPHHRGRGEGLEPVLGRLRRTIPNMCPTTIHDASWQCSPSRSPMDRGIAPTALRPRHRSLAPYGRSRRAGPLLRSSSERRSPRACMSCRIWSRFRARTCQPLAEPTPQERSPRPFLQ